MVRTVRAAVPSGRRRVVVVACALGVLAGPAAGGAYAAPDEPSPGGGNVSLEELRKKIEKLHDRAGSATDAYNAAEERTKQQQREIVGLARKIDRLQDEQRKMTDRAGAMARAQYRAGGLPDEARLVLDGDPDRFLSDGVRLRQGQQAAKGFLDRLGSTREKLDHYARDATRKWESLEQNRKRKAAAKKKITGQLKQAEELESKLAKDEREKLRQLEDEASYQRQAKWLKSGILDEIDSKGSKAGKEAIAYATQQIGKDYEWGAEGPTTFDCSGLTLRAWQAAGEEIPRTSQEQWKQLPRIPVKKMRPGDLIIFKQDASHVGMYVGDGAMVHAPRTGRQITIEGAGSLPILGVVRPDK
ncbi:C40 family peptidase [Streptomyces sp. HNM0574]|uniref:C40 family peptidase n=1 Tax=Streptomyces sp. HNM0574 TaxID=2714954 RepID=UPI00146D6455|nr:C40 family peptidase [Streptomyces sp. HNM0574]NLU67983.1 glycoside hydrolase [Streptomyces sp. HNM0574]